MFAKLAALLFYHQIFLILDYRYFIVSIGMKFIFPGMIHSSPTLVKPTKIRFRGPIVYALIEPSIYMIASILPTTRNLHRQVRRKSRQTAQLRKAKRDSGPKHDIGPSLFGRTQANREQ